MSRRVFVLDTNVLMHDPVAHIRLTVHTKRIPMVVLEELAAGKKGVSEVARNVRQVSRFLDELMAHRTHAEIDAGLALNAGIEFNDHRKDERGVKVADHANEVLTAVRTID